MSYTKYTKAATITPHDTNAVSPTPDAIYVGEGNWTEQITAGSDFPVTPVLWLVTNQGVSGTAPVTEWQDQSGSGLRAFDDPDRQSGPILTAADATIKTSFMRIANNEGFKVDDNSALDFGADAFTWMIVYRQSTAGVANANGKTLMAKEDTDDKWELRIESDSGGANIRLYTSGTDVEGTTDVGDEDWRIVTLTRAATGLGDARTHKLYIDGTIDNGSSGQTFTAVDFDGAQDLYIGHDDGTATDFFGDIAEIIMWDAELTAAQLAIVWDYLNDRHFTGVEKTPAQIKMTVDGTVTSERIPPGVYEYSPTVVFDTGSKVDSIVALYK